VKTVTRDRAAGIFLALSRVPPAERAAQLSERCGEDEAVRREVERLLARLDLPDDSLPGSFLDRAEQAPPTSSIHDGEVIQPAGTVVGDFVVIRQIGAGGTGVVYLAHQQHPARIVALKVLRHEFLASAVQRRFEIEAELLGHLHNPGISQIYAAHPGDATTPPYIAMELVNGPPLTEFADSRSLSVRERVELVARACDAVQHAHQRGIIHRDLKPGNILVNEDGQPKVLDFGVARTVGAQVSMTTIETQAGQLVGTLAYMSPEQIEAAPNEIDTRTDIHALGVILFRLLTGRLPFGHDDPPLPELARRIVHKDATRLGAIDPALRGDLEIIVARALAKEKERRYPSAESLANDLRRYLAGQPISASADSAWYLVRRQIGRYRLALGLSAAVVVALALLASYAIVQRSRAAQSNLKLQDELSTSTIERARLLSLTGNLPNAEDLLWRELFTHPESRHARWTLWDVYSREPSLWRLGLHAEGTQSVHFSPDGRYVLSGGRADGLIRLIEVASGQVARTFTANPPSGTRRAFFASGGTTFVSGSEDGTLRIWNVETGAVLKEISRAAPTLNDLAIAADGTTVVTTARGEVKVWSLATGQLIADFTGIVDRIWTSLLNPDGTIVMTGADDGTLSAFDVRRRKLLWKALAHRSQVASIAFTNDGRTIASGGGEGLINLWSLDGERLRTIASDNGRVRNLAFDRSGLLLAAAGQWKTRLWNLDRPLSPPRDFGGAEGSTDVDITADAGALTTCHGASGQVRLWDLVADSRTHHWAGHNTGAVGALIIEPDAGSVLTSGNDGTIARWRLDSKDGGPWLKSTNRVNGLAFSGDQRWLVHSGYPRTAAVWDARTGRRVADLGVDGPSRAVAFSEDNRHILVGDVDGTLKTWGWADEKAVNPRTTKSTDTEILAMVARGKSVFIAHRKQALVERDIETGRELRRWVVPAAPFSVALSPDGRTVAVGTWVGAVDIWDVQSGRLIHELKGQTALINGLDFSPDGTFIVSSSRDGSTRLWDLTSGKWMATVASRPSGAEHVRFFPDGARIAIGYQDGEVEIRDLNYFFRYVRGNTEYQLSLLRQAGGSFPRADEVLAWSRRYEPRGAGR
jgi:WD40 repeat protein/tRNA A-37 threonylcarbamoyl transferase component Bud32